MILSIVLFLMDLISIYSQKFLAHPAQALQAKLANIVPAGPAKVSTSTRQGWASSVETPPKSAHYVFWQTPTVLNP